MDSESPNHSGPLHHCNAEEVPPFVLRVLLLPEAAQGRHLQGGLGQALLQGVLLQDIRVAVRSGVSTKHACLWNVKGLTASFS